MPEEDEISETINTEFPRKRKKEAETKDFFKLYHRPLYYHNIYDIILLYNFFRLEGE